MIDSGVAPVRCLQILGETQENKKFAATINGVRKGNNLGSSMKMYPKVFDDLYTNLVAAGEAGGILDTIFQRLSISISLVVNSWRRRSWT